MAHEAGLPFPGPRPTRELCIMACVFCKDLQFQAWADLQGWTRVEDADDAKSFILGQCQVDSRNKIDTVPAAAERFHSLVRVPFLAWREAQS